jgi:hypothetical protein
MCHLLTIAVSDYSGEPAEVFRAHGLEAASAVNPNVWAALPKGAILLDITKHGCSCNVYGGAERSSSFDESAERARYSRKGWSPAKIAREIDAKRTAHQRRKSNDVPQQFCHSVELIARSGAQIALVSHLYSGLFAEEAVSIKAGSYVSGRFCGPTRCVSSRYARDYRVTPTQSSSNNRLQRPVTDRGPRYRGQRGRSTADR